MSTPSPSPDARTEPTPGVVAPPVLFTERAAPAGPPSWPVVAATVAVGVLAAGLLTGSALGVGWTIVAVAVAVAMPVVGWRPGRTPGAALPRRTALAESCWIPAAVLLAAVPAVRAADWLALLCTAAAVGAGAVGVAGPVGSRSVLRGVLAVPAGAVRGTAWLAGGLPGLRGAGLPRLAVSLLVGVGLLAVFAPLLAGADPTFAAVLDALVPRFDAGTAVVWAVRFTAAAAVVLGSAFLLATRRSGPIGPARASSLRSAEWALPLGLLAVLFALFVGATLTTLFGSDAYVRADAGPSYAEYARGGFWQLLVVAGLTLVVVVAGARWAPVRTAGDRLRFRVLLGGLIVLTLVVVASALYRMTLYQQAYGLTVLRLLVAAVEVWLAAGFVLVLVAVLRLRPDLPTRGVVGLGVATLLVLAALNPEGLVAAQNVQRYAETGRMDVRYLAGLSADAVPVLATLPEPARSCALEPIADDPVPVDGDWRAANLAAFRARDLLSGARPVCTQAGYRDPSLFPEYGRRD